MNGETKDKTFILDIDTLPLKLRGNTDQRPNSDQTSSVGGSPIPQLAGGWGGGGRKLDPPSWPVLHVSPSWAGGFLRVGPPSCLRPSSADLFWLGVGSLLHYFRNRPQLFIGEKFVLFYAEIISR